MYIPGSSPAVSEESTGGVSVGACGAIGGADAAEAGADVRAGAGAGAGIGAGDGWRGLGGGRGDTLTGAPPMGIGSGYCGLMRVGSSDVGPPASCAAGGSGGEPLGGSGGGDRGISC